jgi:hypothetical protein
LAYPPLHWNWNPYADTASDEHQLVHDTCHRPIPTLHSLSAAKTLGPLTVTPLEDRSAGHGARTGSGAAAGRRNTRRRPATHGGRHDRVNRAAGDGAQP